MTFPSQSRSVFSESDLGRLGARMRAIAPREIGTRQTDRLLSGDLSTIGELSGPTRQAIVPLIAPSIAPAGQLERMVGATLDYVGIAFLERAINAAAAVVRITDLARNPIGTSVMVSPRLVLTNHHVCATAGQATGQLVQFHYELDIDGGERAGTDFRLAPETLFVTSPVEEFDFTLVAVGQQDRGTGRLVDFGHASLSAAPDKHAIGDFVTLIQHPAGNYKQIALRENRVLGRGQSGVTLHYTADTLGGSSGSPVYNDQFQLIAIHHSGGPNNDRTLEDGTPVPVQSNEGIRVSAIVRYLRQVADTLSGTPRSVLVEALDAPAAVPARLEQSNLSATTGPSPANASPVVVAPLPPIGVQPPSTRETTPVTPPALPPALSPLVPRSVASYASAAGYSPMFLDHAVPLPRLSPALWASASAPTESIGADGVELRFAYFSVVQHADRRMPALTAANLEGPSTLSPTGGGVWQRDPRVRAVEQVDASCFTVNGAIRPMPLAPPLPGRTGTDAWHYTNCCPVARGFAEQAELWLGVDRYILNWAFRNRVSVFAGPILSKTDPIHGGIILPRRLWKVVVAVTPSGAVGGLGFLVDQSNLMDVGGGDRSLGLLVTQTTLVAIEQLAGVSFAGLRDFARSMVTDSPLQSYQDLILE